MVPKSALLLTTGRVLQTLAASSNAAQTSDLDSTSGHSVLLYWRPLHAMAEESKPSDLKIESLAGSDEGSVTGDWDEQEEVRLLRKIDMRCMVSFTVRSYHFIYRLAANSLPSL